LHFGETAELPGVYREGELDLVGTVRGVVDLDNVITGDSVIPGDVLIGVESNGLHTNGFSLARKALFDVQGYKVTDEISEIGGVLGDVLLAPHTNYLKPLKELFPQRIIHGIAHLTGGGFKNNIIRILPQSCQAKIKLNSWEILPIFKLIQNAGEIEDVEMYKTFNKGIGIVIACDSENENTINEVFTKHKMKTYRIGSVAEGNKDVLFE
ncbi:MAG: phosphoribosylformylglycinamidine cyclo-ligase, partial [Candidatus Buchananbacteria bacterium CG10_big_fil_rev_8_21_14_0_10_42_9]